MYTNEEIDNLIHEKVIQLKSTLSSSINSLDDRLTNKENYQLSYPLDNQTNKSIQELILYPITISMYDTTPQTAANYTTFFIADNPYLIVAIDYIHGTAGTSTPTLQVEKLTGTTAKGSGSNILSSAFTMSATANTVQYGALVNSGVLTLVRGDRLALKSSGTLTNLKDVCVTVYIKPI